MTGLQTPSGIASVPPRIAFAGIVSTFSTVESSASEYSATGSPLSEAASSVAETAAISSVAASSVSSASFGLIRLCQGKTPSWIPSMTSARPGSVKGVNSYSLYRPLLPAQPMIMSGSEVITSVHSSVYLLHSICKNLKEMSSGELKTEIHKRIALGNRDPVNGDPEDGCQDQYHGKPFPVPYDQPVPVRRAQ